MGRQKFRLVYKMCSIEYHQGLQCKESCLVYVLQREGLPFQSLFSQSWDLRFEESAQSLGLSIRPWELVEQLGEELGILETLRLSLNDLDSCNCLQDILIECDTYYCPWHQHFGREHFNHYYLIETVVDGIATCVDPMMSDNPQCFSFDNLAMGFRHAWLIKTHGIINNHARQFFFTKAYQHLSHMKLNFGEWYEPAASPSS